VPFIDPSYLRYIHDAMLMNSLNKENPISLPDGLVGFYDEEIFLKSNSFVERKKILDFFAVWSIVKKEVSASFVAQILNSTEIEIINLIRIYSRFFNSWSSGKYQLYHERFRIYILARISNLTFEQFNKQIITLCQSAIAEQSNYELEEYALEYLSAHLYTNAMVSGNGSELLKLAYNTTHWNRQIEVSKGFEWSKRMLQYAMEWAVKYDDDEVIECALNKIDLNNLEQNDAQRIVDLVANNDLETSLQRIEAFGGNDKEGLQRKFILYILCLMELTLLESKDKPFRREAIENLLKHHDEHLPVEFSVLNWKKFFPSFLMSKLASLLKELDIDYSLLYKRTKLIEFEHIIDDGIFTEQQFYIMHNLAHRIENNRTKSDALRDISIKLFKQNNLKFAFSVLIDALKSALQIQNPKNRNNASALSIIELIKQGHTLDALQYFENLEIKSIKNEILNTFFSELIRTSNIDLAKYFAFSITEHNDRDKALSVLSLELIKNENIKEANTVVGKIYNKNQKIILLKNAQDVISTAFDKMIILELVSSDNLVDAEKFAYSITSNENRNIFLQYLSIEYSKKGFWGYYFAKNLALNISNQFQKSNTQKKITIEIAKNGDFDEALEFAKEIGFDEFRILSELFDDLEIKEYVKESFYDIKLHKQYTKVEALISVAEALTKRYKLKEAIDCVLKIDTEWGNRKAIKSITSILCKKESFNDAFSVLMASINYKNIPQRKRIISNFYKIAEEFNNRNNIPNVSKVLDYTLNYIKNSIYKNEIISDLKKLSKFAKDFGDIKASFFALWEAQEFTYYIFNKNEKFSELSLLANEIVKLNNPKYIKYSIFIAKRIDNIIAQSETIKVILTNASRLGYFEKSISFVLDIKDKEQKFYTLINIFETITNPDMASQKEIILNQSFDVVMDINNLQTKNKLLELLIPKFISEGYFYKALLITDEIRSTEGLKLISIEIAKYGKFDISIKIAKEIHDDLEKNSTLLTISTIISRLNQNNPVYDKLLDNLMAEIINLSYYLSDFRKKYKAQRLIAIEFSKQKKILDAQVFANNINDSGEKLNALKEIYKLSIQNGIYPDALEIVNNIDNQINKFQLLLGILKKMPQDIDNNLNELLQITKEVALGIDNIYEKDNALKEIFTEMLRRRLFEDAINVFSYVNNDFFTKSILQLSNLKEFIKFLPFERTLEILNQIENEIKIAILIDICIEYLEIGDNDNATSYFNEALKIPVALFYDDKKINIFNDIFIKLLAYSSYLEQIAIKIPLIAHRQECWQKLALHNVESNGWQIALTYIEKLQNQEARIFYLKGWVKAIKYNDISNEFMKQALLIIKNDIECIEVLMQLYAQNELFFCNPSEEKIKRLNKTLNIQWALELLTTLN